MKLILFVLAMATLATSCLKRPVYNPEKKDAETVGNTLVPPAVIIDKDAVRSNLVDIFAADHDCSANASTGRAQLRLLTRDELNNSVRSIFRLQGQYKNALPVEQKVFGFKNNSDVALISSDHASAFAQVAKEIAAEIVDSRWAELVSCPITAGASCAETFARDYGALTWRRPLEETEVQALLSLFKAGADVSNEDGLKLMIRGLLNSPYFLYRSELGSDGQLNAFERASALSFFFWGTTPDRDLFKAASDGSLMRDEVLLAQAQRLLADSKAKVGLNAFVDSWLNYSAVLNVNKDSARYPQFTSDLRQTLAGETENFFDYLVRTKKSGFADLFAADYTIGNQALADFYKGTLTTEGAVQKISLAGSTRRGLLGQASLLSSLAYASETGPIQRGVFVRDHLLCEVLASPPPNLMITPPAPREGATTRERFAEHTASPSCSGCHVKIDGVGFGMEDFDAIGLFRTMDSGKTVDTSGNMVGLDGKDTRFSGTQELSQMLANSERAQKCLVVQTFRMAHGRMEQPADTCSIRRMAQTFVDKKMSLAELLVSIITDASYTQRSR